MSAEKQSRVDLLEKKVKALTNVLQEVLHNQEHLRTLAAGTFETIKLMPGYKKAIDKITEKAKLEDVE
jgi:peptidyl-tRNA hydrolase